MNSEVYTDVGFAKTVIEDASMDLEGFKKRSFVYPFSTENLNGYFDQIDFEDKRVLTVTASGDHALNAILYGSKEVNTFDINRYTKYYLDLKKAAITILSHDRFITFLTYGNELSLSKDIYIKIRDELDDESRFFWDSLFERFKGTDIRNKIFGNSFRDPRKYASYNRYLDENNYYELQKKIRNFNISFTESNIISLAHKLKNDKFDLILLSNISDYIHRMYDENEISNGYDEAIIKYKNLILNLANNLNENGKIVCAYLYEIFERNYDESDEVCPFYIKRMRDRVFGTQSFKTLYFDSIHNCSTFYNCGTKDAVIVYTRRSK
jgi:hypothetical protein